jgi:uncharacterized OB-fold protein
MGIIDAIALDVSFEEISDETVLARYPGIRLDNVNKNYYRGLLSHRLMIGRCADCGSWHTPLRPRCPQCWSESVRTEPASGRGSVYLLTRLYQGPASPDVDYSTPWPLAAIELVEQPGLRVVSTIVECPPALLRIGLAVSLTWISRDGAPWPAFRPAAEDTDVVA